MKLSKKIALLPALLFAGVANAAVITEGFTFSVASGSDQSVGNHFHSSTGGDFGNPAGKAEVGNFSTEEVRGLSEYDLSGLSNASSAFVTFDVFGNGLFPGVNDFAFDGTINITAYQGNNIENLTDYQAPTTDTVGSFSTAGISIGDIFSFNITDIFNDAIDLGWSSLGIRLSTEDTINGGGAWVFDDFRLTTTSESNVPEPSVIVLMGLGLAGLGFTRRRRK